MISRDPGVANAGSLYAKSSDVGLVLVKSQTVGTGVSSVTVTNAFSADYDNYKIIWTGGSQSVDTNIAMYLGAQQASYYLTLHYSQPSGGGVANATVNNGQVWIWAGGGGSASVEVLCPFLNMATQIQARVRYATIFGNTIGHLANSSSFTSFTFFPGSGTMTGGTIRVYGYRN